MVEFGEIIEKLKDVISSKKISGKVFDKDVAMELGIPQTSFATMKKRNSIPYAELIEFCATKKLSINWLFFDQPVEMLIEETNKFFQVRYFTDLRASAGGGAEVFDENYELISIDEKIIHNMVGDINGKLEAIHVEGESMEPTLYNGSIVFIDREQTNISKDGIFIASTNAGLFIKRIRQRADGMIELISDNKTYSPELLAPDEVRIVGRVVGNIESL
ncbi:MAG: LexA family transcriptional regulator [Campylobacterota bacterium]|nr:LexA family transcriptional regulator [Campylobacterota bacterium]